MGVELGEIAGEDEEPGLGGIFGCGEYTGEWADVFDDVFDNGDLGEVVFIGSVGDDFDVVSV